MQAARAQAKLLSHTYATAAANASTGMQMSSSSLPQTTMSSFSHPLSDSAALAQAVARLDAFRSSSGDTALDRPRGSGASWGGRSSDERRREEEAQSESDPGGSQSRVSNGVTS